MKTKETCIFILCAGRGDRWNNYMGIPKQLIRFNGETLLERTARLVNDHHHPKHIYCVAEQKLELPRNVERIIPLISSSTMDTFLSTEAKWCERNIILLGDVYYSKKALQKIFNSCEKLLFFGKVGTSKFGKNQHGEIFALKFCNEEGTFLKNGILKFRKESAEKYGNLWDLYHTIVDLPYHSGMTEGKYFRKIWDHTDDFDLPADYDNHFHIYNRLNNKFLHKKIGVIFSVSLLNLRNRFKMRKFKSYKTPPPQINVTSNQ